MSTALRLGPADHGRPLTLEEFEAGDFEPGYKYELGEGSLYVSPTPNPPEDIVSWRHPSIREYWVFDIRQNATEPTLIAHCRHGKRWIVSEIQHGEPNTSQYLPDFELINDPRRWPES